MNLVDQVEAKEMKKEVADVHIGDTVKVHMRIVEGEKERIQVIEGVVIKMRGGGARKTLTVRKISFALVSSVFFQFIPPELKKLTLSSVLKFVRPSCITLESCVVRLQD